MRVIKNSRKMLLVFFAVFVISSLLTIASYAQLEHFTLMDKEYILNNGKWYTSLKGKAGDEIIPQRIVVRLKDRGFLEDYNFGQLGLKGIMLGSKRYLNGFYVLSIAPDQNPFDIAITLEKSRKFDVIEFDAYGKRLATPNDPYYTDQWNLSKIEMSNAWDITTGNSSIILSIIDSGVLFTHQDLDGNIWVNPGEDINSNGIPDFYSSTQGGDLNGVDDDENDFVDDLIGWDFAGGGNNPQEPYEPDNDPDDTDGHGTSVAGISSAQTNNYEVGSYRGISGVAGGWGTQKGVSLMVLRDGGDDPLHALTAQAIEYAAENGASVINLSSSFDSDFEDVRNAINDAVDNYDVVIVAAAGEISNPNDTSVEYPARYSKTLAVGATNQSDNRYSNCPYGPQLDVMAPSHVPTTAISGGYISSFTGTSASTPHVSALASLIRSIDPGLTYSKVIDQLTRTAKDLGTSGRDDYYGYGRIDAEKALKNIYVPAMYSTISSALTNSVSGQTIYISSGTYTENLNMKSNVDLVGENYYYTIINGTITFSNDDYVDIEELTVKGKITISYSDYVSLTHIISGHGNCYIEAVSSESELDNLYFSQSQSKAFYCHDGGYSEFYDGSFRNKTNQGGYIHFWDTAELTLPAFCTNNFDLYVTPMSYAWIYDVGVPNSVFSSPVEGSTVSSGTVEWDDWHYCGLSKKMAKPSNIDNDAHVSGQYNTPDKEEYENAKNMYRSIKSLLREDRAAGIPLEPTRYNNEFNDAIGEFKQVIGNYPNSNYAILSLYRIAASHRALKEYELLNDYMQDIAGNEKYNNLHPHVLNCNT